MERIKKLSNQLGKKIGGQFTYMIGHEYGDSLRKLRRARLGHSVKNKFSEGGTYSEDATLDERAYPGAQNKTEGA